MIELRQPYVTTSTALRGELVDRGPRAQPDGRQEPSSEALRPSLSANPPRIRVLLADDHRILRHALAAILQDEQDLEVVGEASDGLEAVELAARCQPDVILMDVTMPRLSGVEATRQITEAWPQVRVIGLSMHEENGMAAQMRAAGASDYLTKGGSAETLLDVIRREPTMPGKMSL
ncbi:MAG: response regulator transcription factor [Thermoguttaceae bacterium]